MPIQVLVMYIYYFSIFLVMPTHVLVMYILFCFIFLVMPIQVLVMYILFLSYYTTHNMDVHGLQHKYFHTSSFKIPLCVK